MDSSYVINNNTLCFTYKSPTDTYEIDFDKIKDVKDCVLLIKALMNGLNNGYEPKVFIDDTSFFLRRIKTFGKR